MDYKKGFYVSAIIALIAPFSLIPADQKELHWDWDRIDTNDLAFPPEFQFCAASAEYQVSGGACFYEGEKAKDCPESNWSRYEQKKSWLSGKPVIESSGKGIDHWNRYKEDVDLIKQLGVSVYRFSLDWARIQPREGYYDEVAIQHYHDLLDELRAKGLTPMITLHHFVNPGWFEDKGAFEKEENIAYLIEFSKRMFKEFHAKAPYWCTINEPGVYAAQTYITNHFPRPEKSDLGFPCNILGGFCPHGAAVVVKNLLKAHIALYKELKQMPGGKEAEIGIVHNIIHFEPYHSGNIVEKGLSNALKHVYCEAITQFLITGQLTFKTWTSSVIFSYPDIKNTQDFIGLNYYSHVLFDWSRPIEPQVRPEDKEIKTDMYYGIYAEGIVRAIKELSPIGKPIYITENGLADAKDDRRELWFKRYIYAVSQAIKEGANVGMFCAWSAMDNFEWNLGYDKQFGLYAVNPKTYERTLKAGAEYFRHVAHQHANLPYSPPTVHHLDANAMINDDGFPCPCIGHGPGCC